MEPEEIQPLKDARDHLDQWVESLKKANNVAPDVQKTREIINWQIEAYENYPTEARTVFPENLREQHISIHSYLTANIPPMPSYLPGNIQNSLVVTTSAATHTLGCIYHVGSVGTQAARDYSEKCTSSYLIIQQSQERPKAVRELIARLGSTNTLQRFDKALNARDAVKIGTGERTAAAIEIRTLLEGIKADLWQKSRKWPNENMTWGIMAERLAKNGPGGTEYHELLSQEAKYQFLFNLLSTVGKDREGKSLNNIENFWAQTLDHIFAVLGLIKS